MPVTAKLSRKFYDRLGDDVATELVEWFNTLDATYKSDLRELNDLNWERFKAEMHSAIATSEGNLRAEIAKSRSDVIKWMFVFWTGSVMTQIGLTIAVFGLRIH